MSTITPVFLICPDCQAVMELLNRPDGNGRRSTGRDHPVYRCVRFPKCKRHQRANMDGSPAARMADTETRRLRLEVHRQFDQLWNGPDARMTRTEAYHWLAEILKRPFDEAHIGLLDADACHMVLMLLDRFRS